MLEAIFIVEGFMYEVSHSLCEKVEDDINFSTEKETLFLKFVIARLDSSNS